MKHRLLALFPLICFAVTLAFPVSAVGTISFSDVDDSANYAGAIQWAAERGYISGYPDGRFGADDPVTRAQLTAIFYRAAGSPDASGMTRFSDVRATAYYANAASWAEDNGLVSGYPDGRFGVNDPVTRQQVAAILWRWAGSPDVSSDDDTDEDAVSSYAQTAVDWSRRNNILAGRTDGSFAPHVSATRVEVVSALYQYMNLPSNETEKRELPQLQIEAGGQIFTATLADNPTTRALLEQLPITISMSELNGNEKYYYLPDRLPTNASRPGNIHAGDLMLYGSDCLVLFYENFSSSYSYTTLGSIDDPAGLAAMLGRGSVEVTFRTE